MEYWVDLHMAGMRRLVCRELTDRKRQLLMTQAALQGLQLGAAALRLRRCLCLSIY